MGGKDDADVIDQTGAGREHGRVLSRQAVERRLSYFLAAMAVRATPQMAYRILHNALVESCFGRPPDGTSDPNAFPTIVLNGMACTRDRHGFLVVLVV